MPRQVHNTSKNPELTNVTILPDNLLSDRDFYIFMKESIQQIERLVNRKKWYLDQKVNDFIFRQTEKHGLKAEL